MDKSLQQGVEPMAPIDLKTPFTRDDVDIQQCETVYDGFFSVEKYHVQHRLFAGGVGPVISRELFVRGEAVGALLYDPVNHLIGLVEQFRIGALNESAGPWCLEVVAGMVEPGESTEDVVRRELEEETALVANSIEYICSYLPSPGGTNEKMHLYCVPLDLSQAGGIHGLPEEGEDIRMHVLAADDVFAVMLNGRFNNAATLISLQWLQANYWRLRDEQYDQ